MSKKLVWLAFAVFISGQFSFAAQSMDSDELIPIKDKRAYLNSALLVEEHHEDTSVSDSISRSIAELRETNVPSGRLLEVGAVFHRETILQNNGSKTDGLTQAGFNDALQELYRAQVLEEEAQTEVGVYKVSKKYVEPGIYPLSLGVIKYESIDEFEFDQEEAFAKYLMDNARKKMGSSQIFAGTTVQASVVYGANVQFVLPEELVF